MSVFEFLWTVFSRIRIKYRDLLSKPSYLDQMRENKDQTNSNYGHFSRSIILSDKIFSVNK